MSEDFENEGKYDFSDHCKAYDEDAKMHISLYSDAVFATFVLRR